MNRRTFLLTAAASGAGLTATYASLIEPKLLDVTHHVLGRGSSDDGSAITFVHLTDLHLHGIGSLERRVARVIREIRPAFIVITGDSIDDRRRLGTLREFLAMLPAEVPKFATLGNWEHWCQVDLSTLARVYEEANGTLLVNRSIEYAGADTPVLVTGLDDSTEGRPDIDGALAGVTSEGLHIVLEHAPAYRDYLVRRRRSGSILPIRYMLAGHTHGGQVDLFGYRPILPRGTGPYVEGWFRDAEPALYVSRGIGTTALPIRFGARPELAVFSLSL